MVVKRCGEVWKKVGPVDVSRRTWTRTKSLSRLTLPDRVPLLTDPNHPRTAEASGVFTTTGRILFYNIVLDPQNFSNFLKFEASAVHGWNVTGRHFENLKKEAKILGARTSSFVATRSCAETRDHDSDD